MTRVRSTLILLVLVALAAALPAGAFSPSVSDKKQQPTRVYTLLPASGNPEGVAFDQRRGSFYVSVVTDGAIYRGTLDDPVVHPFLPGGQDGRTQSVGVKVDHDRLYIAGGDTGAIFVYDTRTRALVARFDTGAGGFLNDLAVANNGDVYVTDSLRPVLWRVSGDEVDAGAGTPESIPLLPEVVHVPGFNVNGIVALKGGRELIIVNSSTGKLYRVSPTDDPLVRTIVEIPVTGGVLTNADGLVLRGRTLFAVRNAEEIISEVRLTRDASEGVVLSETTDPTFKTPTTADVARDRLLVVNSEFFETDGPPYTVSSIRVP